LPKALRPNEQLVVHLGPGIVHDLLTGAVFVATLIYPDFADEDRRHELILELAGHCVRMARTTDPTGVDHAIAQWHQINWDPIIARSMKRRPALGHMETRLRHRMAAGRAGIARTYEGIFNSCPVLPPGMTSTSLNQICQMIRSDVHIDDPNNIESLVWRPSLKALHLCMACLIVATEVDPDARSMGFDIQDAAFIHRIVLMAQSLENIVHEHPGVAMTRDRMTLVRWVG